MVEASAVVLAASEAVAFEGVGMVAISAADDRREEAVNATIDHLAATLKKRRVTLLATVGIALKVAGL